MSESLAGYNGKPGNDASPVDEPNSPSFMSHVFNPNNIEK
jgi:hypothetical protein